MAALPTNFASIADASVKHKSKQRQKKKGHKRSHSATNALTKHLKPPRHHHKAKKSSSKSHARSHSQRKVERKLGPIEIGRIKYKGTKYKDENYDFLQERIHRHARSSSFTLRKKANPLPKGQSLSQHKYEYQPNGWQPPEFLEEECAKLNQDSLSFLHDNKPMHVRDRSLDRLKNARVPKGKFARQEMSPFSWKPIDYEYEETKEDFLSEKFWFDSSAISADYMYDFSHLLQSLPPEKLLSIRDIPPPTGYESKLNYLNQLKKIVFEDSRAGGKHDSFLHVPLGTLNESSDESSEISGLSDIAESIENDMDKRMTDALDEILRTKSASPLDLGALQQHDEDTAADEDSKTDANEGADGNGDEGDGVNTMPTLHEHDEDSILSEELDKQMTDALDEILKQRSMSPMPERSEQEKEAMDRRMEDALNEILAPSPSPVPRDDDTADAGSNSIVRRQLIQTIQENLMNIHENSKTNLQAESNEAEQEDTDREVQAIKKEGVSEEKKEEIVQNNESPHHANSTNNNDSNGNDREPKKEDTQKSANSDAPSEYKAKIPAKFVCPISKMIIDEAVMAADGRIYDKANIELWLKTHDVSPITRQTLRHKQLMPFHERTEEIKQWKIQNSAKKRYRKRKKRRKQNSISSPSDLNDTFSFDRSNDNGIKDVIIPLNIVSPARPSSSSVSSASTLSPLSIHDEVEENGKMEECATQQHTN